MRMTQMTIDEVAATIKSATAYAVSKVTGSLDPDGIAEYVLRRYTSLDWDKVTALQAALTPDGVLHIDFAYAAPAEHVTVNLSETECHPDA